MQQKEKVQSLGRCCLCNATFAKSAMGRHVEKCAQEHAISGTKSTKRKAREHVFHLLVQGKHSPEYWLHLDVLASRPLQDLDSFLRSIWLECCGHCSAFTIDDVQYSGLEDGLVSFGSPFDDLQDHPLTVSMEHVLGPGSRFSYEYDFGSTTKLELKVVSERETVVDKKHAIRLLARNEPSAIHCACGAQAVLVCGQCSYDDSGWLCKECVKEHECGEEMCLPVVNSPRVGVCGYTGD